MGCNWTKPADSQIWHTQCGCKFDENAAPHPAWGTLRYCCFCGDRLLSDEPRANAHGEMSEQESALPPILALKEKDT